MTKKIAIKPVATAVGAALVGALSAADLAHAAGNPFGLTQLDRGYTQVAMNEAEGKCGGNMATQEGKCGGNMKPMKEGQCGEGKCGADMAAKNDTSDQKAMPEGKCGEGKCGGKM